MYLKRTSFAKLMDTGHDLDLLERTESRKEPACRNFVTGCVFEKGGNQTEDVLLRFNLHRCHCVFGNTKLFPVIFPVTR